MGNFGDAIKYLYEKFILRDVLSFVTPGAIVVLATSLLFLSGPLPQQLGTLLRYSSEIHWLLYIPLFGVFYMIGFAVQCFGEIIRLVRFYRDVRPLCSDVTKIFTCNWHDPSNPLSMRAKFEELTTFWEATERDEGARQGHERLVVMKQMCINGCLATIIAVVLLAISYIPLLWVKLVLLIILVALPLVASLFWGHRVHVLRQDAREQVIIDRWKKRYTKTQKSNKER